MIKNKRYHVFLIIFGAGIAGYSGWLYTHGKICFLKKEKAVFQRETVFIYVHIEGQINRPGLYKVPSGARLGELIKEAGGLTGKAETSKINLARKLKDGEKIIVPEKDFLEAIGAGKAPEENYIKPPIEVKRQK